MAFTCSKKFASSSLCRPVTEPAAPIHRYSVSHIVLPGVPHPNHTVQWSAAAASRQPSKLSERRLPSLGGAALAAKRTVKKCEV